MAFRYLRFKLGIPGDPDDNRAALAHYEPSVATDPDHDRTVDVPLADLSEALLTYDPGAPEHARWLVEVRHQSPVAPRLVVAAYPESEYTNATQIVRQLSRLLAEPDPDVRQVFTVDERWRWSLEGTYLVDGKVASLWVQQGTPEPASAEASADA